MILPPPPGYSPTSINRQTVSPLGAPGWQSLAPLGYGTSTAGGLPPSSYSFPSSQIPAAQGATAAAGALGAHNTPSLLRALRGFS